MGGGDNPHYAENVHSLEDGSCVVGISSKHHNTNKNRKEDLVKGLGQKCTLHSVVGDNAKPTRHNYCFSFLLNKSVLLLF